MTTLAVEHACPICQADRCCVRYSIGRLGYVACRECRHLFQYPINDRTDEQYGKEDADNHHVSSAKKEWDYSVEKQQLVYKDQLNRIEKHAPRSREMIDIGCGNGAFLAYAAKRGWNTAGVEPRHSSCEVARQGGAEIHESSFERIDFGERRFDAVVLWQVIEHMSDPVSCIELVRNILKPGGVVAISTPNISSIGSLLLGQRWPAIEPDSHYHLFSSGSLKMLMARCGFETIHTRCHDIQIASIKTLLTNPGPSEKRKNRNTTATSMRALSANRIKLIFAVRKLVDPFLALTGLGENIYGYYGKKT